MRCHAEVPVTWPDDDARRQTWTDLTAPLLATTVRADGLVDAGDLGPVRLVSGTHLARGAIYRVAEDRLRSGRLEAVIESPDREVRASWTPAAARGRAEVRIACIDRFTRVKATSSLRHLRGDLVITPRPADLAHLRLRLNWVAVDLDVRVDHEAGGQRLVCELRVRGAGLWRPTLAPLLRIARPHVVSGLDDLATDLARQLSALPDLEPDTPQGLWRDGPADAERRIRQGLEQVERRLQAVATTVAGLSWWRRTAGRWRRERGALPRATWPPDELLIIRTWPELEAEALRLTLSHLPGRRTDRINETVRQLRDEHLRLWHASDEDARRMQAGASSGSSRPALTDENLDTRWLATPWSTIRRLSGAASDAEAQQLLARGVSEDAEGHHTR